MQPNRPVFASSIVVFGKVPFLGDFLRIGAPSRTGEALEQWVEQGASRAELRLGTSWASQYLDGSPHAFVYRSPRAAGARDVLVGVILPSTDSMGRRFPLIAYAPALVPNAQFAWPHVLPMVLGEFLEATAKALHKAGGLSEAEELVDALGHVPPLDLDQADAEARAYAEWTSGAPLARAFAVVYGEAGAPFARQAIHVLADAVAPFRGDPSPATTLGLRMPLGAGGAAAAAFWLDVLRRLAGLAQEVRTAFWSFDETRGSVIVQLGDTPPSTLEELWAPDARSEYLCDLTHSSNVDVGRLLSELPPQLVEALRAPQTLVCEFLDQLVTVPGAAASPGRGKRLR